MYKIACTRAVNQRKMLKRYQMNAMAMYYDPKVWYKNNLIFQFHEFNESLKILEREKMK